MAYGVSGVPLLEPVSGVPDPEPVGGATVGGSLTISQDSLLDFKNSVLTNVAAIISTNGSWGVTSDGQLVAQKVEAKQVVAETYAVKAASDPAARMVGVALPPP